MYALPKPNTHTLSEKEILHRLKSSVWFATKTKPVESLDAFVISNENYKLQRRQNPWKPCSISLVDQNKLVAVLVLAQPNTNDPQFQAIMRLIPNSDVYRDGLVMHVLENNDVLPFVILLGDCATSTPIAIGSAPGGQEQAVFYMNTFDMSLKHMEAPTFSEYVGEHGQISASVTD